MTNKFSSTNKLTETRVSRLLGALVRDDHVLDTVKQICNFDRWWRRRMDACVLSSMQHHGRSLGECISANVADVRSLAHVGQKMNLLRAQTREGLATDGADVGFLV